MPRALLPTLLLAFLLGGGSVLAATHTVRKGETVYGIAREYRVTPQALLAANHLPPAARIKPGQKLAIPGASTATAPVPSPSAPHPLSPAPGPAPVSPPPPAPAAPSAPDPAAVQAEEAAPKTPFLFITPRIKQLIDSAPVKRGRWKYIVFHHSGTPSGNAKIFDYFHRNVRGMENGLAYHFVIGNGHGSGDGEIEVGGRWLKQLQGGHLHSDELNMIALGVCFVGDFNTTRPSKKQIAAAIELTSYLRDICGPPTLIFKAHREINPRPTECPGKLFPVDAFHKLFDN